MSRVHLIIRATLELDDDTADVDLTELYEPVEEAAAKGLDDQTIGVTEVVACRVLDLFEAGDLW